MQVDEQLEIKPSLEEVESSPSIITTTSNEIPPISAPEDEEEKPLEEDIEMKEAVAEEVVEEEEPLPSDASEVIYLNNLNEQIKLNVLKQSLKTLFKQYGPVINITAHKSIRMRGQAFITMLNIHDAVKAVGELKGFPLYGKPLQLAFARTESDAIVKVKHGQDYDKHLVERLVRKKMHRKDNPLRRKYLADKIATKKAAEIAALSGEPSVGTVGGAAGVGGGNVGGQGRKIVQMPDEYLPPNKILFVQNLPDDTTKDSLELLFKSYPNLIEVRTIPGRKNIAFIEFLDDTSSSMARDSLHNFKIGEFKLKVAFAKLG